MRRRCALIVAMGWTATSAAGAGPEFIPIVDARLRYENVDQQGLPREADAVTARMRAGLELAQGGFALLAEAEAVLAIHERYNSSTNELTQYPLVVDPENIELNRLQLQY